MYITSGNVDTLINWFNHSANRYNFLCLLVAGHLNDEKFFSDVFDKKETIDVVSGREIAVFLFSNALDTISLFEVEEGHTEILPGRLYGIRRDYHLERYLKRVTEITPSVLKNYPIKESAIKTSQTISSEICSKYNLDLDDIPCLLFLAKEETEPFIIRTKGEIDIENFFQIIKDVRKLSQTLPNNYELDDSIKLAETIVSIEQKSTQKAWVSEVEYTLNESLNEVRNVLQRYTIPIEACEILVNQQTARNLWSILGQVPTIQAHPLAIQYADKIKLALAESDLKRLARKAVKNSKELRITLNYRSSVLNRLKKLFLQLHTAEEEMNLLCQKHERKLALKAKYRPIKQFVNTVLGITAKTKEILSFEESIRKIIQPN